MIRVREESRQSQKLPDQIVFREPVVGVVHHGFERVDVPAVQAILEQEPLLIDDALDDLGQKRQLAWSFSQRRQMQGHRLQPIV
jgi:hypothetical protein